MLLERMNFELYLEKINFVIKIVERLMWFGWILFKFIL